MTQTSLMDTEPVVNPTSKTVADLDYFMWNTSIVKLTKTKKTDKSEYVVNVIMKDGVEYRMPNGVLLQCQKLKKADERIVAFKVLREGIGKEDTSYTVLPLYEIPKV